MLEASTQLSVPKHGRIDRLLGKGAEYLSNKFVNEEYMSAFRGMFDIRFDDSIMSYIEYRKSKGDLLVVIPNHQDHGDGFPATFIAEEIIRPTRLRGFYLVGALTMATGHQGLAIQTFHESTSRLFYQHGSEVVGVLRPKDRIKYDINDPELEKKSRNNIKRILNAARDNHGITVFMEGSVAPGRIVNPITRGRKGMIEPEVSTGELMSLILRTNQQVTLIPVGIQSYDFYSADTRFVTLASINEMVNKDKPGRPHPIASATVGIPITKDQIISWGVNIREPKEVTDALMKTIADYVQPQDQGIYRRKY